ncbi:MAG: cytochrome c family protein [Rhodospirillales bacterium]
MKSFLSGIALAALLSGGSAALQPATAQEPMVIEGLTGNVEDGAKVFRRCSACHVLEAGKNRVGPSLHGIIGATAGQVEGFRYSKANLDSGVTWTPEVLFTYLENPRKFMPGNRMAFPGLKSPQQRVDLIAYMAANGGAAN